jgi:Carboxypeptidase regulatory-like domain/TonB dependent receptor-like, beta-barrel
MLKAIGIGALIALVAFGAPRNAAAQAQAANGNIEGTVRDTSGAVLPGVTVTVTNVDTGTTRSVQTTADGVYRVPLLPLGRYKVTAELQGFKTFERQGLTLSAGQVAVVNVEMAVGNLSETVTVSGESPVAQPGKIDLGRTIGESEVRNLPLVSRNPYNFAFLQTNVTGYENNEFGVPRINANGSQMHTNYQLDGNTNTEKDRAGLRMLPISEVLVREVKVITNGFAPEFGQTTGMVYNAITPSGTNDLHGSTSFRFRRNPMSSKPFFLSPTARKPDTEVNDFTATLGGPLAKDKWHYFGAYEYVDRSTITGNQVITVNPAAADILGITLPPDGVIPSHQKVNFLFGKTDYQINSANRLSGRYFFFKNLSPSNINAGLTTTDRATDFNDRMDSASVQLVSSIGATKLNEVRVQYARRHQFRTLAASAADGPAITVNGVALFGGPRIGDSNSVGFDFTQGIWQVIDNLTWIRGSHSFKGGIDAQFIADDRVKGERFLYTFATSAAYLAAKSGANPFGYVNLQQDFGDLTVNYDSAFYGLFIQDDWQLNGDMKLLFGLRYDIFDVPSARTFAPNPYSTDFTVDKNNLAPRVGFSWALDHSAKTVLRASTGLMYEPPLLDFYDNAILNNGDPRSFTVTAAGTDVGAPPFPSSLASAPPGFALSRQNVTAVDHGFRTQYAWLTNIQVERALRNDMSVAVGYVNSTGRNLPVLIDVNLIPTGQSLSDGRPIYSSTARVDPTFNHINVFQSIADASYNALTVTFTKRMTQGWQAQVAYTLARGVDNGPLTSTYVIGSGDDRVSDFSNLDRDKGVTPFNQAHTLGVSSVIAPSVSGDGLGAALLNNNQLGIVVQANSGLPFNIISNLDLNGDSFFNDRPLGIDRNVGRLGTVFDLDLRYSRFIPLSTGQRIEAFFEAKNLFNVENLAGVNRTVTTNAAGQPNSPISTDGADFPSAGKSGYDQRLMQLGVKFIF